jgi:hypothetical protein
MGPQSDGRTVPPDSTGRRTSGERGCR